MSPNDSQRVLVVAEFAPGSGGGGWIILKQLLRGLDWGRIYWWSLFNDKSSTYQFGGRHHSVNVSSRLAPNLRLRGLKGGILEHIFVPYAASDLLNFIRSVKPDFILFLAHLWGIPVVHHIMPKVHAHWHLALHDMPDTASNVERLGRRRAARFMNFTEDLYRIASSRAVISPAMAEDMRRRTGMPCSNIFRCAVEPEFLAGLLEPKPRPDDEIIRIGYAGTIVAESTFARFVVALQAVRQRLNRKVEIHLFSWHSYRGRSWFDPSLIFEHGHKSEAEIHSYFQQFTWGLAIMKLADDDPRYNHMSFPCKFTPSLAAGLPLICIGHRCSALIELVKNYRLGLLLTDEDENKFADKLYEGLTDFSRFDQYRLEIARCAEEEFNAERNREKLHEMMREAQYQP
ncbi:MAG: hypothetical protein LV481_13455 [Methylacidiphilales bacterium]|nr:hypothetical protein [Candidatus Methylacidiphilales bacterium]